MSIESHTAAAPQRLVAKFAILLLLAATIPTSAVACPGTEVVPYGYESQTLTNDKQIRDSARKEVVAVFQGKTGPMIAIRWSRWEKMSREQREEFIADPDAERNGWLKLHGDPKIGTRAYGAGLDAFTSAHEPEFNLVGFGHYWFQGSGTCSQYKYWDRKPFKVPWQFLTPKQSNGALVLRAYGYRLPDSPPYFPEFVVLKYQVCGEGALDDGQCPVSWWRQLIDR